MADKEFAQSLSDSLLQIVNSEYALDNEALPADVQSTLLLAAGYIVGQNRMIEKLESPRPRLEE